MFRSNFQRLSPQHNKFITYLIRPPKNLRPLLLFLLRTINPIQNPNPSPAHRDTSRTFVCPSSPVFLFDPSPSIPSISSHTRLFPSYAMRDVHSYRPFERFRSWHRLILLIASGEHGRWSEISLNKVFNFGSTEEFRKVRLGLHHNVHRICKLQEIGSKCLPGQHVVRRISWFRCQFDVKLEIWTLSLKSRWCALGATRSRVAIWEALCIPYLVWYSLEFYMMMRVSIVMVAENAIRLTNYKFQWWRFYSFNVATIAEGLHAVTSHQVVSASKYWG